MALMLLIELALAFATTAVVPAAPASAVETGGAVIVPIQGELSEEMVALTLRAIRRAKETGASALVFEIDTVGGNSELMDRIIDKIESAGDLRTVAFVTQKAASAGALVAISCERLYMKPGSNIGSALPILQYPFGIDPSVFGGNDDAFWEKIRGQFRAHFRAKAQAHDRPAALAEAMVYAQFEVYEIEDDGVRYFVDEQELEERTKARGASSIRKIRTVCKKGDVLNLTAHEALATGLIDGLAISREDLLEQLGLPVQPLLVLELSWSEHLAHFTQSWGIVLLVAGLIAVFIEVKLPGFGLPGLLGATLLALYLFGKYLAGLAEITEILLIVAGVALIAVEIFVLPGTLFSGILGVVAVIAGLVLASQQTFLPQSDRPLAEAAWWANARSLSIGLVVGVGGMIAVAHFLPSIPFLNRVVLRANNRSASLVIGANASRPLDEVDAGFRPLPGAHGITRTVLRPAGKVEIEGRELDATSEGQLVDRGREVEVVRVEAAHVVVRPTDAGGRS